MAYWVQEVASKGNMSNYRSYICDYRSDISKLPRFGIKGEKQENDSLSSSPCSYGSEALVLADTSIWILGKETNTWQEV